MASNLWLGTFEEVMTIAFSCKIACWFCPVCWTRNGGDNNMPKFHFSQCITAGIWILHLEIVSCYAKTID